MSKSTIDWVDFEAWLATQYAASTAKKARRQMQRWATGDVVLDDTDVPRTTRIRRWEEFYRAWYYLKWWATETDVTLPRSFKPVPQPPQQADEGPRRRKRKEQKAPVLPIDRSAWRKLRQAVRADNHPVAVVLDVMMSTGLRVGDVLRVEVDALKGAMTREDRTLHLVLKSGKIVPHSLHAAPRAWPRLLELVLTRPHGSTVAACVTRGSEDTTADGAAYKAAVRRWQVHAKTCGLAGAANLHRLRHTVLTMVMIQEGTLEAAKLAGSHNDDKTTRRYTPYAASVLNANALRKLNEEDDA